MDFFATLSSIYQASGSQPGCREEVSGVPPNIEFTTFFSYVTTKGSQNCHFIQVTVPPNFFQSYRVP